VTDTEKVLREALEQFKAFHKTLHDDWGSESVERQVDAALALPPGEDHDHLACIEAHEAGEEQGRRAALEEAAMVLNKMAVDNDKVDPVWAASRIRALAAHKEGTP
jgi:spore cortex formation protein SpoVR/YcgB (stage V sporulation)